jgi:hypothetical protein
MTGPLYSNRVKSRVTVAEPEIFLAQNHRLARASQIRKGIDAALVEGTAALTVFMIDTS